MDKPFIFCHMLTSIDGKIEGKYMKTPKSKVAGDVFYDIAFGGDAYYKHQGWLSGRTTTDENFTMYKEPELGKNVDTVPKGDFIGEHEHVKYYISIDSSGKIGWDTNEVVYKTTKAHVIEVLTDKASNAYKAFLRKLNISYLIVGEQTIDHALLMDKLYNIFDIKVLMLGGGGVLNWSFIQSGYCDEVSIVMAPAADGSSETASLFETGNYSKDVPIEFKLIDTNIKEKDILWLRYKVENKIKGVIKMKENDFKPIFPIGEENKEFDEYFIGQSYLQMLNTKDINIANVTFEPSCRNNWHIHHGGGQILLITDGTGYYQEWDKEVQKLKRGDRVHIDAEVKHWHGATKDSWFSHISVEVPASNRENEWLEPVSDEYYNKLK